MSSENNVSIHPGAYPVLRIALLYAAGIVAGCWLPPAILFGHLFWTLTSMLLIGFFVHFHHLPRLKTVVYLLCIIALGVMKTHLHQHPPDPEERLLAVFDADDLHYHGTILSDRTTRSDNLMVRVEIDSVQIRGLPTWLLPFTTEVLLRDEVIASFGSPLREVPTAGNYIRFHGDLRKPSPPGNPHQFDYSAYLDRQGIHTQVFASKITDIDIRHRSGFWLSQQIRIKKALSLLFSGDNSELAKAIILGDRSGLDPDLRTGFSRAGLAHLMAVSGMHVGFILMPVWFVLPWFRGSPIARLGGLLLGGGLLLLYAGITGFSVSVSRASVMAFFMMIARLCHKPGTSMNILGAAALILLLYDPMMLFDVGFQLSFLAVIIILTTLPGTRYLLPPSHRYRKTGMLFQFVMVSVLVQGGLYPLLVHYFQEFSLAGPLSNTLAVPFVQMMFLWTFACLGTSLLEPNLAAILNVPGDLILTALTRYVTIIGTHSAAWIEATLPGNWMFGLWFFGVAILGSLRIPAIRWKMVCGLLFCLLMLQAGQVYDQLRRPDFTVTFFDVGQADAVLLQTPGGQNYLYDTGRWTPQYDSGERTLIPELKAMDIRKLEGIILSHPHADHIGGMVSLLNEMPVDTIYQSPETHDTGLYHRYMNLAREKEVPVRLLSTGDLITTDPALPMMVLAPSDEIPARDPNNRSVVLLIQYGDTRLLLAGDAEHEAESYMVDRFGGFLRSDLLKVGHHGSRTSSTTAFLSHVNAQKGVVSLARHNRYHHPHPEAMKRLQHFGIINRFTSIDGAVIFRSDGRVFEHVPWR